VAEIKKKTKIFLAGLIIVFMAEFGCLACRSNSSENFQSQETIHLNVSFGLFPGEDHLVINTGFWFINVPSGPPINTSLQAFQHFSYSEYYIFKYGEQYLVNLFCYYSQNIGKGSADEVTKELLKAFNHTSLKALAQSSQSDNNTVTFRYQYGYLPNSISTIKNFLKYKPEAGFGKLLNDNFLRSYVPGDSNTGVIAYYNLTKVGSEFRWDLYLCGSTSVCLRKFENGNWGETAELGERILDLNQILNNSGPIVAIGQSIIRVDVSNRTEKTKKYFISIEEILPNDYTTYPQQDSITYIWSLSSNKNLENIRIKINVGIANYETNSQLTVKMIVIGAILAVITAAVIYKCHTKMKSQKAKGRNFSLK
jgi:hypothetical protein